MSAHSYRILLPYRLLEQHGEESHNLLCILDKLNALVPL
jgi:hypothetical protein